MPGWPVCTAKSRQEHTLIFVGCVNGEPWTPMLIGTAHDESDEFTLGWLWSQGQYFFKFRPYIKSTLNIWNADELGSYCTTTIPVRYTTPSPYLYQPINTRRVMWSVSNRSPLLSRIFPDFKFRLGQPGSHGQFCINSQPQCGFEHVTSGLSGKFAKQHLHVWDNMRPIFLSLKRFTISQIAFDPWWSARK